MRQLYTDKLAGIRHWAGGSRQWMHTFLEDAPSRPEVLALVAMGSAVRDRGHGRSDFDILIVYRGIRPTIEAPMEVDLRFARYEELNDLVAKGNEIVCWAMKFGIGLYDPEDRWGQLGHSWRGRIPLPSAIEARKRAVEALKRTEEMLQLGDESAADDLVLASLTQFARERLLRNGVFPASRPELPDQLRALNKGDSLAKLLESAMYGDSPAENLLMGLNDCLL